VRVSWRLPLTAVLATAVAVPAAVVLPTVTPARAASHPVAPALHTVPLAGVDVAARAQEPVPGYLARDLASLRGGSPTAARARLLASGPRVLTARLPTAGYQTLAVTWRPVSGPRATPPLIVSARYRTSAGWSGWTELGGPDADAATGPEAQGVVRAGTAPYFTGPADGVQVRVDTPGPGVVLPPGLRVDLIDPGSSAADAGVTAAAPVSSAAAAAVDPNIVTRAQWGADESLRDRYLNMSTTYKVAFVHHTAGTNSYTAAQGPAQVRGLYAYYVNSLGYADMGYNFLVDKYGTIYEGRYGSMNDTPRQAATGGFNTDTMAVSALGNFSSAAAPDAMVTALGRVIGYRLAKLHANPLGHRTLLAEDGSYKYPIGKRVTFDVISGHRQASATSCPGDNLFLRLPGVRRAAKAWMRANLVNPHITGAVTPLGRPTDVRVTSGVLRDQSWQLQIIDACSGAVVRSFRGQATPGSRISVAWGGRDSGGALVPAGRYVARLTSEDASSRSVPWQASVVVGESPPVPTPRTTLRRSPEGRFVPLPPTRLAATSSGAGLGSPQILGPGGRLEVPVLGRGAIPGSGVTAVALAVTTSCASRATTVSGIPGLVSGSGAPIVSTRPGGASQGTGVVAVGRNGAVGLVNASGYLDVTVAAVGYWTTTSGLGLRAVSPRSIDATLDTGPSGTSVAVAGRAGVPADAAAAVLTVRARPGNQASRVTVWPAGRSKPSVPSVVLDPGSRGSGGVIVAVGDAGSVRIAGDSSRTRLAVDVDGYLSASTAAGLHPLVPRRLTNGLRVGAGAPARVVVAGRAGVPNTGVAAVVLQLSARSKRPTAVTVWPNRRSEPTIPDLVVGDRRFADSLVTVPLGARGAIRLGNQRGAVRLSATVVGWVG